jgi:K+-transporting ATPase ATPase C chain
MTVLRRQLLPAFVMLVILTVVTGVVYPLLVTGVGQLAFHGKANGSLITRNGEVVGSKLIGQGFAAPKYFHPRPSAAGAGYDASSSGASNLGPTNPALVSSVQDRVKAYRAENGLPESQAVPVDAVTASGSGLDPDISIANARLQAPRVAQARGMTVQAVLRVVDRNTDSRSLGILGESGVNVLSLNLGLDRQ